MAERITKEMVIRKFRLFCEVLGTNCFIDEEWDGTYAGKHLSNLERPGLFLDMGYRAKYVIRQYTGKSVLTPFGLKHRNAAEMWDALDLAISAINLARAEK